MNKQLKMRIVEIFDSQAEFSMRVKEDCPRISNVINDRQKLPPDRQKVWAKLLKCKVSDIFNDDIKQRKKL